MLAAPVFSLLAQIISTPTHCQATPVTINSKFTDWQLIGCGDGFPDDLAWALDRSDSADGSLDGRALRRTTGRGAVVYVIDSGIKADHDELMRADGSAVIAGFDLLHSTTCPPNKALNPCYDGGPLELELDAHGTGVASVIAGLRTGIAPDAKLVSVRVLGTDGGTLDAEEVYVDSLDVIRNHAFDPAAPPFRTAIVNLSGGFPSFQRDAAVDRFMAKVRAMIGGVDRDGNPDPNGKRFLFVVAAGNIGAAISKPVPLLGECNPDRTVALFPAIYGAQIDGLVTVGGVDTDSSWWGGSCGGSAIDVAAPATAQFVASITARDRFRYLPDFYRNGTSYAAPYVSGIAARLLEADPSLSPVELEAKLKESPAHVSGMALPIPVLLESPVPPRRRAVRK